ncbi:hypothetical protein BC629DRAFT_1595556 [Irpex lacteus]|nr:hypothetical protein BC629DRAFT_1595556 [Irpex lacteus]
MVPHYTPLTVQLATNPDSLVTMVKQMIDCIHDLRYKTQTLHRNISPDSIMHTASSGGGERFVLTDFDSITIVDDRGQPVQLICPRLWTRTGNPAFMPFALISATVVEETRLKMNKPTSHFLSTPHCVRFDFESLFWVALWCSICVVPRTNSNVNLKVSREDKEKEKREKKRRDKWVARWESDSYTSIETEKYLILCQSSQIKKRAPLSPAFEHLRGWLLALSRPFSAVCRADDYEDLDFTDEDHQVVDFPSYETGNGIVTRDKLLSALEEYEARMPA